jgi:hypothetical protein
MRGKNCEGEADKMRGTKGAKGKQLYEKEKTGDTYNYCLGGA